MNTTTAYTPSPQGSRLVVCGKVIGFIEHAGDDLLMPVGNKTILFEMHPYFGPIPLNKKTGNEMRRIPKAFWRSYEKWCALGRLVDGKLCVIKAKHERTKR